jgi:hypothetical protein
MIILKKHRFHSDGTDKTCMIYLRYNRCAKNNNQIAKVLVLKFLFCFLEKKVTTLKVIL